MKPKPKGILARTAVKVLKFKQPLVGTPAIITNQKKEILLGKRSRDSIFYPNYWGLPGGVLEYNEKLKDCVIREVKEELGINIRVTKQARAHENFPNKKCSIHSIDIPFYAKIVQGIPKPKDETSEVKWFKPSEIKKMKLAYTHKEILKREGIIK